MTSDIDNHWARRDYIKTVFCICLLGVAVYTPVIRTNFFMDDVDSFGGLCESLEKGTFTQWVFRFANGHLAVIPSLCQYIIYKFFDRSIVLWHSAGLLLHTISISSVFYILLSILKKKDSALILTFLFATSTAYKGSLEKTSTFNHLCAFVFTVLSLCLLCSFIRHRKWPVYVLSLFSGLAAVLSSAYGLILFPAHIVFAWAMDKQKWKTLFFIPLVFTIISFGTFWALGRGGVPLNLLFGIIAALKGIFMHTLPKLSFKWLGAFLFLAAVINIARYRKGIDMRTLALASFLAVGPLVMSLSFRSDFPNSWKWSRFHQLPVVGILLIIGYGLETPNMDKIVQFVKRSRYGLYILIIAIALIFLYAFSINLKVNDYRELRKFEDLLGEASLEFAEKYTTRTIAVPNVQTSLPHFPFKRDIIYICRYTVPYREKLKFIAAPEGDDRFISILRSKNKYEPILNRMEFNQQKAASVNDS